ncbi:lysosomal amino acid transporter 1 homolog [Microcaecilia unicolor]|uniref:Lysosomal amino acid transporter 1 homolog n=1 Tax=Microcaecilia unicolor TaxID=1415580 RepID=A0A6P7WUQ2_9AMPH|nr:lysosomal amino acid transporter 1 homolog [Microcaecilia unicolor]
MPSPLSLSSAFLTGNFSDCINGSLWIWNVLQECVQDERDVASVVLGLFSILCFMAASFPQCWRSCKTGNMDRALSIWFLMGWLAGDSCNFVGAFLSNQLPLQTYTAIYYVLADLIMVSLYFYYKLRNQRRSEVNTPINIAFGLTVLSSVSVVASLWGPGLQNEKTAAKFRSRALLATVPDEKPFTNKEIIGFTIGSVSSLLYLTSRLPQIITNFKRKSTEGLAYSLFALVILGNLTYGLSILLKNPEKGQSESNYVIHHLPWLIGSLGVLSLDVIISIQFFLYRKNRYKAGGDDPEEKESLLHNSFTHP